MEKELSQARVDYIERQKEKMQKLWTNPEYRAKMIRKQKTLGYRTY